MFDSIARSFSSFFSRIGRQKTLSQPVVEDLLKTVTDALLQADVPLEASNAFIDTLRKDLIGARLAPTLRADEYLMKVVNDRIREFLGGQENHDIFTPQIPATILVMGLQGSGKTTTTAKLGKIITAKLLEQKKKGRILAASVDFYRPAAIDQLEVVSLQAGIEFYRATETDILKAVEEIDAYRKKNNYSTLLLDTAGRLHVDEKMLQELSNVDARLPNALKILVLDSMTGQESLRVARVFEERVGFAGAILTKMDSDTRGGAAFAFRYALKKPIFFVGIGEHISDLERFHPDRIATRMLGMGDITSLAERATEKIKAQEQEQLSKAMRSGRFTLEDFAQQIDMMSRLGSLGQVMKYIPGVANMKISQEKIEEGETEMKRFRAIISSMTKKERIQPSVLDASRKKRIAQGSGVTVPDVNMLLDRFNQSQQLIKQLGKMGRFF